MTKYMYYSKYRIIFMKCRIVTAILASLLQCQLLKRLRYFKSILMYIRNCYRFENSNNYMYPISPVICCTESPLSHSLYCLEWNFRECFCINCGETLVKKNQCNPQGPITYDHLLFGHFHVVLVGFVGIHDMGCRNIKTYVTGPRGFIIQEIPNYIYTIKTSCLFLINTKCNYKMRPISVISRRQQSDRRCIMQIECIYR